jgi:hypothetical protein
MRIHEIITESDNDPRLPDGGADQTGVYDPTADNVHQRHLDDTRKPKLTLASLNRLKKIKSTHAMEMTKKQELLGIMYGNQTDEEEGL